MKTPFRQCRGLLIAAAVAASLPLHAAQIKTLGGGPNQSGLSKYGSFNGNTLLNAKFFNPYGVAQDDFGNLFIADRSNNKVRRITKPGQADSLTSTFKSGLSMPVGVVVDGSNNVYVLSQGDGRLRKFSNTGLLLKTVSRLASPTALAVDTNYIVYVAELGGSLKKIPLAGPTQLLGPGGLNQPRGIAVMKDGRLAVTTARNHAIYTVDPNTGVATLLAGGNGAGYNDGPGALAQFNAPHGVAVAPNGVLIVADRNNNKIRAVQTNGIVSTVWGVDKTQWSTGFPGWTDGDETEAASRSPVGIAVGKDGTVFDTEVYWHLIRQATGVALGFTNSSGVSTNIVGTNTVVGTNIIALGFDSGEGSSDFVGAPGQIFHVPVTMVLAPGQKIYSLQFGLSGTNETATPLDPNLVDFVSLLRQPSTNANEFFPLDPNYVFNNTAINLLGVGYIERYLRTNLYNTLSHHLVQYSMAKDHLASSNRVFVGTYRFQIPPAATIDDVYRVSLSNPSATAENWTENVPLRLPQDGSLGGGAMNGTKRITMGSRLYIVGDTVPLRWFNAGDFGEGKLLNNDVIQIFESALGLPHDPENVPLLGSDLYDAMDSSDGSSGTVSFGTDVSINGITTGDTLLRVDDLWVTFRRSLDPTLKWFARYWSNGVRQVVEVPNALASGFDAAPKALLAKSSVADVPAVRPSAALSVNDAMATAGATLQFPVTLNLQGGYPLRVMMLGLKVEALDGSPALTESMQFQTAPGLNAPDLSSTRTASTYASAWLDHTAAGYSASGTMALLKVSIPANAGPGAAYRVHFTHFSASPNGHALFNTDTTDGLILLSDRSGSTWGDGISDEWRLRYFGSIFSSDGALGADPDGDGVINSVEYQNGTDPTDTLSH